MAARAAFENVSHRRCETRLCVVWCSGRCGSCVWCTHWRYVTHVNRGCRADFVRHRYFVFFRRSQLVLVVAIDVACVLHCNGVDVYTEHLDQRRARQLARRQLARFNYIWRLCAGDLSVSYVIATSQILSISIRILCMNCRFSPCWA